jgi:OpgC protein
LRPLILCGQHSLPIFCFSVFLSFGAHWILMQYTRGVWEQLVVSAAGILIMVAAAWLLDRAARVPNLFVETAEFEAARAAIEVGKA